MKKPPRPRQHRFVEPTPPPERPAPLRIPDDWKDKEPSLRNLWRTTTFERVVLVLAVAAALLISWLVARRVP